MFNIRVFLFFLLLFSFFGPVIVNDALVEKWMSTNAKKPKKRGPKPLKRDQNAVFDNSPEKNPVRKLGRSQISPERKSNRARISRVPYQHFM